MATAFGVAAGVIQVIDAASKLKTLWNSVKNAPDDLIDCVHDIQRTARLLEKSKELVSSSAGISDDHFTECIQDLDNALAALRSVTSDLQKGVGHIKRLGALKIVLKKDEIARGRRKLERTHSLLSTAQQNLALTLQLQHTSMLNQNYALLLQVYSVVQTTTRQVPVDSKVPPVSTTDAESMAPLKWSKTRLANCSSKSISRRSCKVECSYSIRFPRWLTVRCFEIVCRREISLLQLTFTSYNIVHYRSPAHDAARWGDSDQLKRLFENRKASLLDQSASGQTLLHAALQAQNLDTTRFLVTQCPRLAYEIDVFALRRLFHNWTSLILGKDLAKFFHFLAQIWDLLAEYVDIDEDTLCEVEHYFRKRGVPGSWAVWLPNIPKAACLGVGALPREARISIATSTLYFETFQCLTGTEISTREVLELTLHSKRDYLFHLERLSTFIFYDASDDLLRWGPVIREILAFDECQGPTVRWSESPLRFFLCRAVRMCWREYECVRPSSFPELWNKTLRKWIQCLEDIGVNLVHYGQREVCAMNDEGITQFGYWRCIDLRYGPRPVDWEFIFVPDGVEYDWAGDFWNWIENPELFFVPATFPVDEMHKFQSQRDWMFRKEAQFRERRMKRWLQKMYQEEQDVEGDDQFDLEGHDSTEGQNPY